MSNDIILRGKKVLMLTAEDFEDKNIKESVYKATLARRNGYYAILVLEQRLDRIPNQIKALLYPYRDYAVALLGFTGSE